MKGAKERVLAYAVREDGTYDPISGKTVEYPDGFQFSFVRPEAFAQLDDEAWDNLTGEIMARTGSKEHIGVFDGQAETSFRAETLEQALFFAKMFNQHSVLDWKAKSEGADWQVYLIRNDEFNEFEVVDYDAIIKRIL